MPVPTLLPLRGGLCAALLFLFAGCASETGSHSGPPAPPAPPPPPLAGSGTFFADRILAELKVGQGIGFASGSREETDSSGSRGSSSRPGLGGGLGGSSRAGGGSARSRQGGDSGPPSEDRPVPADTAAVARVAAASTLPPMMIHLQLTNRSPDQLGVTIVDFLSPLGNFVVNPERVSLAPGQSLEVEPMTSRLDNQFDAVEATLALRLAGQTESRTIRLTAAAGPATAPEKK